MCQPSQYYYHDCVEPTKRAMKKKKYNNRKTAHYKTALLKPRKITRHDIFGAKCGVVP